MESTQFQKQTVYRMHIGQQGRPYWITMGAIALFSGGIGGASVVNLSAVATTQQPAAVRLALVDTALVGSDRPLLQFGDQGPEVRAIQALLQIMGYYSSPIDGRFQESTVLAVINFQQAAGLEGDGILGPTTWAKLLPIPQQISSTSVLTPPTPPASSVEASDPPVEATPVSDPSPSDPETSQPNENTVTTPAPAPAPPEDIALPTLRPGMRGPAVTNVQERLRRLGFFQGAVDGVFGSQTEAAVKAAQRSFNLSADGIVGPATWAALLQ